MTDPQLLGAALQALGEVNAPAYVLELGAPLIPQYLALDASGGVIVTDEHGQTRTRPDPMGSGREIPMTVGQLIEELKYYDVHPALRWNLPSNWRAPHRNIPPALRPRTAENPTTETEQ